MRIKIAIIICVIVVNLLVLTIGYSQSNVNVQAVVPLTEANIKQSAEPSPNPSFKENKFQYYFEKYWNDSMDTQQINIEKSYAFYDSIATIILMVALMFIIAMSTLIILRAIEYYKICRKKRL
ncbi:hypothetical protein JW977_00445 [Candidatus Falkowbacteria bacterium]|nr:hypothetical protein [Candidatus Falkowbacteria bacterium]